MPQSYTCAIGYISARIHKCHMVAKVPKRIQRCHLKVTNVPIDLALSLSLSLSLLCPYIDQSVSATFSPLINLKTFYTSNVTFSGQGNELSF